MTGRFITFEGLDGSGKSTHLRRAAAWLEERDGAPPVCTHEPGGTPLGDELRRLFLDPKWGELDGDVELLMVFASRRQHLLEVIDPALAAGRTVLCDRFTDSTYAYQGGGRGVAAERIARVDEIATGSRAPNLTLLFDLPAETARRRGHQARHDLTGSSDRLDAETLSFYDRVRSAFLERARAAPDRFRVIDAGGSIDDTWSRVRSVLEEM